MKKRRIRTPDNYNFKKDSVFQENNDPSCTIQGEAYTIAELYQKYGRGLSLETYRNAIYDSDDVDFDSPDMSEVARMDIVDQQLTLNESLQRDVENTVERKKKEKEKEVAKEKPQPEQHNDPSNEKKLQQGNGAEQVEAE